MKSLLDITDYCVFTFTSTSNALKAEKVMKEAQAQFIVMPTPREISTSCGLAVKVAPDKVEEYHQLLRTGKVAIEGIFRLTKTGRKTSVQTLMSL